MSGASYGSGSTAGSSPAGGWTPPGVEELQKLLPQYEIESILGRGGMGAVYKGQQASLGRAVAIKVLPESLITGGEEGEDQHQHQYVERFKLEARSMANLDHPAIISVYDFGQTEAGHLYFVMEFIDGMDIEQYIHACGGKVDPEHAVAIVSHVLDALAYAHSKGIVHRDIKPANVLLNRDGRVKIADFGLAKAFAVDDDGDSTALTGLTMTNMAMGTPDYIAPEALDSDATPDHRADLYAVGVMLYRMLTGKLPRGIFKLPSEVNKQLDPRFDELITLGMAGSPEERFQSASEFRAKLGEMLSQPVAKVKPGQDSGEVKPVVSRSKLNFPATAPEYAGASSTAGSQSMPVAAKNSSAPIWGTLIAVALVAGLVAFFLIQNSDNDTADNGLELVAAAVPVPAPSTEEKAIKNPSPVPENRSDGTANATIAEVKSTDGAAGKLAEPASPTASPISTTVPTVDGEWRSVFDGKSLVGWRMESTGTASVAVVDSALVARGTKGYLYYEGGEFDDFELSMEVKTTDNMNSGVFLHVQDGRSLPSLPEVQIANGPNSDPGGLWTGSLWKGTQVESAPVKDGEWFEMRIAVVGEVITSSVNGEVLVQHDLGEFPIAGVKLGKGGLAFQVTDRTGEGGTVSFRNIRLRGPGEGELKPASGLAIPRITELTDRVSAYQAERQRQIGDLIAGYRGALDREQKKLQNTAATGAEQALSRTFTALGTYESVLTEIFAGETIRKLPDYRSDEGLPESIEKLRLLFVERLAAIEGDLRTQLEKSLMVCGEDLKNANRLGEAEQVNAFRDAIMEVLPSSFAAPAANLGETAANDANKKANGDELGWRNIFNGSDLRGWKAERNSGAFFVEDGAIKAAGGAAAPSNLFWTDGGSRPVRVKDFDLKFLTRSEGDNNSGLYFHASDSVPAGAKYLEQGMEVQLASRGQGNTSTGALYNLAAPKFAFTDIFDWFEVSIEVRGKHVRVAIDGREAIDYTEPENVQAIGSVKAQLLPDGGAVAIQANSQNGAWYFKDIRLRVIE